MVAKVCAVKFGDFLVGALSYADDSPYARFEYSPEWLTYGFSLSPLHMPLRPGVFAFPTLSEATYKGLPSVFADSLPDDFGNAIINAWQARKGLDPSEFKALDRLLYTGKRGMGALEYEPALRLSADTRFDVDIAELVGLSQQVLSERESFVGSLQDDDGISHLLQIGTSAGGARPKAVIAINEDRTKILSGQVDAPEGFEHYLIKFDGVSTQNKSSQTFGDPSGFGVMEYVYYLMANDCDITMMPCDLFDEHGRRHFMTKRFDRIENQKYHCLTLCGMDHADYKQPGHYSYEQLLGVLRKLNLSHDAQVQIYRRMVFNVIARNQDDHTKNVSFFVDDDFQWQLAPAYDIAFSYKPDSDWVSQHQMSINGKRDHFSEEDLLAVAKHITNLSQAKAKDIIVDTIAVVRTWKERATKWGVPDHLIETAANAHRLSMPAIN